MTSFGLPAPVVPTLLGLAAVALVGRADHGGTARRLHRVTGPATPPCGPSAPRISPAARRRAMAAAAGLSALVVVGGLPGVLVGALACAAVDRLLARQPERSVVRERAAAERDLPLALDLLACVLRAGQPPSAASAAVAAATGGPVGRAMTEVARACALGASAQVAWEPLARLVGASATARTLARAAHSGIALADELERTADSRRIARSAAVDARIRRAGVLVVLPLGLCFLPAFVCAGVLPLVVGVAGSVLR